MLNAITEMTMARIPDKPEEIFQEIILDYQGIFGLICYPLSSTEAARGVSISPKNLISIFLSCSPKTG